MRAESVAPIAQLVLVAVLLGACAATGDPTRPLPTAMHAAARPAQRLVVILPGRGDDLAALAGKGVTGAIQSVWPDADVELVALTLAYYRHGGAARRLHEEVILPARQRGYREIWLAGASMGGMGALLYDANHPGQVDGLILLAPYLGDRALLDEIAAAGGLASWHPGRVQAWRAGTWQRELWRHIQRWTREPAQPPAVWLAYGNRDRLRKAMPLLESVLPAGQVLRREGGHSWRVWTPAVVDILARIPAP